MSLSILYRGSLSSCNYGCEYCPFAKHTETRAEHEADQVDLQRFIGRVAELDSMLISVFFTPWGEALIHPRYQIAMSDLSNMSHVEKVAIQTNLSCKLSWLGACNLDKIGIWATFHPSEISLLDFVRKCRELDSFGVQYSVGIVGIKENFDHIREMRKSLPHSVYLWVNAYKREKDYYSKEDVSFLQSIDHLFHFNNQYHASLGRLCNAGDTVVSIDGSGNIKRCHFIPDVIANFYDESFPDALGPKPCTNSVCGCHIGYVHLSDTGFYDIYKGGILERVPAKYTFTDSRSAPI